MPRFNERLLTLWFDESTPDLPAHSWRTSAFQPRLADTTGTALQMAFRSLTNSPPPATTLSRNPPWEMWWGMPKSLNDHYPVSSTPKNGDDKMYVRPEVGTILAYRVIKDREIDHAEQENRLFYVMSHEPDMERGVKLVGLTDTETFYAGDTYGGIVVTPDDGDNNWMYLDAAEKVCRGFKARAAQFDRTTYKPTVGDKVLVAHKPSNEDEHPTWVREMDKSLGSILKVIGVSADHVTLSNGWNYSLQWIQPVALVDQKKVLRERARRSIRDKIASWNSPHEFRSTKDKHYWGKARGRTIAELRSKAERRDATEADVVNYLADINNMTWIIIEKVEPAVMKVREKRGSSVWQDVGIVPSIIENALHCLHVSSEDKTKIAYYPSLRHLREGREVRTTLGKYLTKYKDAFGFDENQCRTLAQKYQAMQTGEGVKLEFKEQNDPDGWVHVYEHGPQSCMKGEEAVKIYASGVSNLRLAYLEDISGDIVARCIVRDSDDEGVKGYIRVYPDPNGDAYGRRLYDLLVEAGYGNPTNTRGCLLSYLTSYGNVVCPYIDFGNDGTQYVGHVVRNGMSYLLVGEDGFEADSTDGIAGEDNTRSCDCCNEYFDEDDITYVESNGQFVCSGCIDDHYVEAYARHSYTELFAKDDCTYCESDGNWYHDEYLERHDVAMCQWRDEFYKIDDMQMTSRGWVHTNNCVLLAVPDSDDNDWAFEDDAVLLPDGRYIHEDVAEKDFITGEYLLPDEDEDGVIQVFTRQLTSSKGGSILAHLWTTTAALADHLDDWVVEFVPQFRQGRYINAVTCITWKGQESPGSAVISFRDLTYDMIRSDETFEKIFEALEERGLINPMEEAA